MLSMKDKNFSGQHFEFFFPEKKIWHYMQIVSSGDNLHKISNPIFWEN